MTKFTCKIFYLCLLFIPNVYGETFSVALYYKGNPPYSIINQEKPTGIFVDIFKRIEQLTRHKFIFRELPVARALKEFDVGNIDIEPGVNEQWRQSRDVVGLYSIAYEVSREVIVSKKENALTISEPSNLYGKSVGVVRGYSYPSYEQAFSEQKITKVENISEETLLKQLLSNRLEYVFIGYRTMLYYQQQVPIYRQLMIGATISELDVKMRVHPNKDYLVNDLNIALATMLKNGDIENIYQKYQ